MLALVAAMALLVVVGFLAGREYDRGIKRIKKNRQLRAREREEARFRAEKRMRDARIQMEQETERQKNKFISSIYEMNPNCKGVY